MRRLSALLLMSVLLFTGCGKKEQIDQMSFVKILGIDRNGEALTLTAGLRSSREDSEVLSVKCRTVAEGVRLLRLQSQKSVFFGQLSMVLLGKSVAEAGIGEVTDYLIRSPEARFDLPLLILRDQTAESLIAASLREKILLTEKLAQMLKCADENSVSGKVELSVLAERLADPLRAAVLPFLTGDITALALGGFAVFKEDRLASFLTPDESVGLNYLNGTVGRQILVVPEGKTNATVLICKAQTRVNYRNGAFSVTVAGDFEQDGTADAAAVSTAVGGMIEQTVKKLQHIGVDAARFGTVLNITSPSEGKQVKQNWNECFPRAPITVTVTMKEKKHGR